MFTIGVINYYITYIRRVKGSAKIFVTHNYQYIYNGQNKKVIIKY